VPKNKGQGFTPDDDEEDDFELASSGGDYWNAKDNEGELHLVYPKRFDPIAWNGKDPAMIADVVVFDGDEPTVYPNAKVGGKALINQLQATLDKGTRLLGKLEMVTPSGKGNPYWSFGDGSDVTAKDRSVARAYLKSVAPF
jgi:hypothetical protein